MPESPRSINVEITPSSITKFIFLAIFGYLLFVLREIVLVVLVAVVIASAIEPLAKWFIHRKIPRLFSVLIIYAALGTVLVSAFYTVVPTLLRDTSAFLSSVPKYIDAATLWNPLGDAAVGAPKMAAFSAPTVVEDGPSIQGVVADVDAALQNISAGFIKSASSVFGGAISFILIVVLSFYLAVQEDGVGKFLRLVTPRRHEPYITGLWKRTQAKIALWMQGQIMLALLVGILVYIGLTAVGLPNALFLAAIAALFEAIPLFGPIIAAIPAIAAAYADGGASIGFVVAGIYIVIHQLENHFIYPLVVKKLVGVQPILVILSLLAGFKLAGFLGIILSVPVASMLTEFLDDLQKKRVAEQN
jgi:predicted PurR-regulated permease PerM